MSRPIDILSAGELLVDLTTAEFVQTIEEVALFKQLPGGSSAHLAMNMARLGKKSILVACVGNDDMGHVLKKHVEKTGVDTSYIAQVEEPTTLILHTRSAKGAGYQPYRGADHQLSIRQFPFQRFEEITIFHTTTFALSRQPAQHVILQAAEKAKRAGCQLSLDINFSEKFWPEKREAQRAIAELCRLNAIVKLSDADWEQLYESDLPAPEAVIDHFMKMGATEVCYTLGKEGSWVGNNEDKHFLPSRPVEVKDPNGAGDAFWAGYLSARLDGRSLIECTLAARKLAELKLGQMGPFPDVIELSLVYEDLG